MYSDKSVNYAKYLLVLKTKRTDWKLMLFLVIYPKPYYVNIEIIKQVHNDHYKFKIRKDTGLIWTCSYNKKIYIRPLLLPDNVCYNNYNHLCKYIINFIPRARCTPTPSACIFEDVVKFTYQPTTKYSSY